MTTLNNTSTQDKNNRISQIITECESENELRDRLKGEFGDEHFAIDWSEVTDLLGESTREMADLIGGPISKNGALVQVMFHSFDE